MKKIFRISKDTLVSIIKDYVAISDTRGCSGDPAFTFVEGILFGIDLASKGFDVGDIRTKIKEMNFEHTPDGLEEYPSLLGKRGVFHG